MKIGFFGVNTGVFSTREAILRLAQTAEETGYESVWTGEHVVATALEGLREAERRVARPEHLGELEISITPPGPVDLDAVKRYQDLGVSRLILMRGFGEIAAQTGATALDSAIGFVTDTAEALRLG